MNNYREYTAEEFAADENFRQWVLDPSDESVLFWDQWLAQNQDKLSVINQATALLLTVYARYHDELSDEFVSQEINSLIAAAGQSKRKNRFSFFHNPLWRVAAVLMLAAFLGWYFYADHIQNKSVARTEMSMVTKTNHSAQEMTVLLEDGSVITLLKGGRLSFPKKFEGNTRQVYLEGAAFFDVAKNPGKPFLVYANGTVTKVLGTSFLVKAAEKESTVSVLVRTGKVSVYAEKAFVDLSDKRNTEEAGVVLTPNQQAVFHRKDNRLEKGIVENPDMLFPSSMNQELIFDDKPVADVLDILSEMYGINIVFDKKTLNGCPISTIFKEETLKQRMNAICHAIGASYVVVDGQIVIHSKGCLR